jgi:glycosyltransferase involved in cell wall biosynthesis
MPLFSVVIPLYNKQDYIRNTIQSVLDQSFKDFELIIVNDGSTDNSLKKAQQLLSKFQNHNIISQENKGLSASRNRGIREAKGELIAFLDADDIWHSEFLNTINELYINYPEASLYGTSYLEKYSDKNILESKKNIDKNSMYKSFLIEDFFETNLFQPIVCQSSLAAKKLVFNDLEYNESINLSEDIDFYIKSNLKHKFAYYYKNLATILVNIPDQITSSGIKNKNIPNFDIYEKEAINNRSLKKYIDFNRYTFSIQYKLDNDLENFRTLLNKIDLNNLNLKQKILIKSPVFVLKLIKRFKRLLIKHNIRLTSY